jgi:hypothetical protein
MAEISITVDLINYHLLVLLTTIRQNPGPGTYEPKANVDKVGKCFISTIKNTGAPSFSLPSLPRF